MKVSATRMVVLAASLSLGLGVAACSSSSTSSAGTSPPSGGSGSSATSAASGTPYQIGATEDLSGGLAAFGKWFQQTWQAEFDSVNKAGGWQGEARRMAQSLVARHVLASGPSQGWTCGAEPLCVTDQALTCGA